MISWLSFPSVYDTTMRRLSTRGVSRDMFSSFWKEAYIKHFDGEKLLVPAVQPGMDMHVNSQLGTILSHGFMCCGYLPVRIAFPVIAAILKGPDVIVPERVHLESFIDFLSSHESSKLRAAIVESRTTLTPDMRASLTVQRILVKLQVSERNYYFTLGRFLNFLHQVKCMKSEV